MILSPSVGNRIVRCGSGVPLAEQFHRRIREYDLLLLIVDVVFKSYARQRNMKLEPLVRQMKRCRFGRDPNCGSRSRETRSKDTFFILRIDYYRMPQSKPGSRPQQLATEYRDRSTISEIYQDNVSLVASLVFIVISLIASIVIEAAGFPVMAGMSVAFALIIFCVNILFVVVPVYLLKYL